MDQKTNLIDQILKTQNIGSDGPLTRDDVAFLVDKYYEHRHNGQDHGEASRMTYACAYRNIDITFRPHQRVAELRKE